jgi:membrane-associated phospholipid phosphatase
VAQAYVRGPGSQPLYNQRRVRRLVDTVGARLPRGFIDAASQLLLFFAAFNAYQIVRGLTDGSRQEAFANADRVIDAERWLGTFFEPGLQQTLLAQTWLIDFANFMYMNSLCVVSTTFLVWVYLFRNEHWGFVRNMFLVAMGLALVGYAAFPTAPPRLIPEEGFTDTITAFTGIAQDEGTASLLVNQYAAVPSMHCAFALMIGIPGMIISSHRWAKVLWSLYPLLVLWVVVVTGNHFWLDGAAGAFVAALSALAASRLARARPTWAWRPATAEARASAPIA